MTRAALVLVAAALAGCGGHGPDPYAVANSALLNRLPVYPGSASPKTTAGANSNTQFGARDWTLPADATADVVITWYERKLQAAGWRIVGKSFATIRATRGAASLSVGVRGRIVEEIANSRGA